MSRSRNRARKLRQRSRHDTRRMAKPPTRTASMKGGLIPEWERATRDEYLLLSQCERCGYVEANVNGKVAGFWCYCQGRPRPA